MFYCQEGYLAVLRVSIPGTAPTPRRLQYSERVSWQKRHSLLAAVSRPSQASVAQPGMASSSPVAGAAATAAGAGRRPGSKLGQMRFMQRAAAKTAAAKSQVVSAAALRDSSSCCCLMFPFCVTAAAP